MNGCRAIVWVGLLGACCWSAMTQGDDALQLEVAAGGIDRAQAPIFCELPRQAADWKQAALLEDGTDRVVPCQIVSGKKPRLVFMLDEPLAAGKTRRYRLTKADRASSDNPLRMVRDDRVLSVSLNEKPVLVYNHAVVPSDDPQEPAYRRSGFIHPLYDPNGNVVSDGMPPDHMHQHGIMYAWVNTNFRDHAVDFWNSAKHEGAVRHKEVLDMEEGPVLARFRSRLEHVDLTEKQADPSGTTVLSETWQVTVYHRTDGFLFDVESEQSCATDDPLVINKYHYSGMAFRGARHWSGAEGCRFLTSEGRDRAAGDHTPAWWCDISGAARAGPGGAAEASVSGMTVFCAPENFRAPQTVRLHPTMPYFVWSPMVDEGFRIEPGHPYQARYRYFVHAGSLDRKVAQQISADFRAPAKAAFVE